jgi:hypothetical protein
MSARDKSPSMDYLRSLAQIVSESEVQKFIKRSADHHHYKWDYVGVLIQPLKSGRFPRTHLGDLNFALANLLVQLRDERSLRPASKLYLSSLYLYVSQVQPGGMQLTETATNLALDCVIGDDDRERLELFAKFLNWLLDPKIAHHDAEPYFIKLGIVIVKGQISEVADSELHRMETHLPSWIRGSKEVKLLSDNPKFPESWNRLLRKIKIGERIKPLLGLS